MAVFQYEVYMLPHLVSNVLGPLMTDTSPPVCIYMVQPLGKWTLKKSQGGHNRHVVTTDR